MGTVNTVSYTTRTRRGGLLGLLLGLLYAAL